MTTPRNYSSIAPPTALSVGVDANATVWSVSTTNGYPAPPFILDIERGVVNTGTAGAEIVLCTAVAPTAFTVVRGYDGTTKVPHGPGSPIEHTTSAIDYAEPNAYINRMTTKGDLHTKDGSGNDIRVGVGTDGQRLIADTTQPGGLRWGPATPMTTKGDLVTRDASGDIRLAVGADTQVLIADASTASGLRWGAVLPLTTKGDIVVRDATGPQRLAVGADTQVLTADASTATGVKWAAPTPLTTKGDIITFGTAPARMGAGVNGYVLISDSSQTLGLRWGPPTPLTTKGDLATKDNTGADVRVGVGTDGQALLADSTTSSGLRWGSADPLTTKGDLLSRDGAGARARLPVGNDGYVLQASAGAATGLLWAPATPLTTKGDLLGFAAAPARVPVGTNGQRLIADSAQTSGVRWGSATIRLPHTWGISGVIAVPAGDQDFILPFRVKAPAGQTVAIADIDFKINAGTSVAFNLTRNGTVIGSYTANTGWQRTAVAVTLADQDSIAIVVTAATGTPKNLSVSLGVDYTI